MGTVRPLSMRWLSDGVGGVSSVSPFSLEPRPDDITLPLTCPYVFKNPPLIPLKVLIDAVLYVDALAEETQRMLGKGRR